MDYAGYIGRRNNNHWCVRYLIDDFVIMRSICLFEIIMTLYHTSPEGKHFKVKISR